MSLALAVDWWAMMGGIYFADPVIMMSALFIGVALIGFLREFYISRKFIYIFSCIILLLTDVCLVLFYQLKSGHSSVIGVLCGSITGVAYYIYIYSSEQLSLREKMTSLEVIATRFWLLFLTSVIAVLFWVKISLSTHDIFLLLLTSFGSLIVPIYFAQQSIIKIGGNLTSILSCLVPPSIYIVHVVATKEVSMINNLVCLLISISLIAPKIISIKIKSHNQGFL